MKPVKSMQKRSSEVSISAGRRKKRATRLCEKNWIKVLALATSRFFLTAQSR